VKIYSFLSFSIAWLLATVSLYAQDTLVIRDPESLVLVSEHASYLEDTSNVLSIQDILTRTQEFQAVNQPVFARPASASSYWIRFTVINETNEELVLEAGGPFSSWFIDFYRPDSSGVYQKPVLTGSFRPEENKEYHANNYWLKLADKADKRAQTFYVRMKSGRNPEYTLQAGTLQTLVRHQRLQDVGAAVFAGIVLVMALYNLFLFFASRSRIYLLYVGYAVSAMLISLAVNNYFVFGESQWVQSHFVLIWMPPLIFMAVGFSVEYLKLYDHPILFRVAMALVFLAGVAVPVANLFLPLHRLVGINQVMSILLTMHFIFSGVVVYRKGRSEALFYILGWGALLTTAVLYALVNQGVLPYNFFIRKIHYVGFSAEIIMFSFALAMRFNLMKMDGQRIREMHMFLVREQNSILEKKVKERTEQLQHMNDELKAINRKLDQQGEDLKEANATKDKLLAIVGHDLRSPLMTLENLLVLLNDKHIDQETFLKSVRKLQHEVGRIHLTMDNVLSWAFGQMEGFQTKPRLCHLVDIAQETKNFLGAVAESKQIRLLNDIEPGIFGYADEDHVRLIIRNLTGNALKFTPAGGVVKMHARITKNEVIVAVTDNGIGMDNDVLSRIFSAPASTRGTNNEKGTGLGLVLCQEFTIVNGGRIWVESMPGLGSTFYFSLPLPGVVLSNDATESLTVSGMNG